VKTPALPMIERVLFTEEQVKARIREVAAEISEHYKNGPLKLIGVLKGLSSFSPRWRGR
jgi:hypoxanthine phosphoribosyltransferase